MLVGTKQDSGTDKNELRVISIVHNIIIKINPHIDILRVGLFL